MTEMQNSIMIDSWARLMRASTTVLEAVEAELKLAGLPALSWYDVLLELNRDDEGGLRPVEIQQRVLLAQYNLSRLISRLENTGYVERKPCEEDGRGQKVFITPEGKALLKRMWPTYQKAVATHFSEKLTEAEARQLGDILRKLY